MQQRAVALAAEVARLQKDLVSKGSALQWLASAGVFPRAERGQEDPIGHTGTSGTIRSRATEKY